MQSEIWSVINLFIKQQTQLILLHNKYIDKLKVRTKIKITLILTHLLSVLLQ